MFVVSEQRLTGVIAPITPFYGTPSEWISLEKGQLTTYSDIYRKQSAVRSVVDFLAGHLARMPIYLYEDLNVEGGNSRLRTHPAQKVVANPNPHRATTQFWRDCFLDYLIYDRVCMVKIRNVDDNNPNSLVRIPAVWYTPFCPNYWRPDKIRIIGNRSYEDLDIENVVYIHGYDPVDPRIGVSPMETLRAILEEEYAGQAWRKRLWENGAQPSLIVTRPLDAPDWDDTARDRFIESLRAAQNRGKPLLLEEGMTSDPTKSFDPGTAQYVESKQFTREEVLRAYNTPIGLMDTKDGGNVGQYRAMLYAETLAPILKRWTDELDSQLLTEWYPDTFTAGVGYDAAIEEKMRGNILEQIDMLTKATGAPFMTRKEARPYINLSDLPEDQNADKLVVPLNVLIGGQANPQDATANNPANQFGPNKPPQEGDLSTPKQPTPPTTKPKSKSADWERLGFKSPEAHAAHLQFLRNARVTHTEKAVQVVQHNFERQRNASLGGKGFNRERWDKELGDDLYALAVSTATFFGKDAAERIGGTYDEDRTLAFLKTNARWAAENINASTEEQLKSGDAKDVWATTVDSRSASIGLTRTTQAMNWGIEEAARQNGS